MEGALAGPDSRILDCHRPEPSGLGEVRISTKRKSIGNDATGPWGTDENRRVGFRLQGSDDP